MKTKMTLAASLIAAAQAAPAQVADFPEIYEQLTALGPNLSREMVGGTQKKALRSDPCPNSGRRHDNH